VSADGDSAPLPMAFGHTVQRLYVRSDSPASHLAGDLCIGDLDLPLLAHASGTSLYLGWAPPPAAWYVAHDTFATHWPNTRIDYADKAYPGWR
jgi:hypothetical protein